MYVWKKVCFWFNKSVKLNSRKEMTGFDYFLVFSPISYLFYENRFFFWFVWVLFGVYSIINTILLLFESPSHSPGAESSHFLCLTQLSTLLSCLVSQRLSHRVSVTLNNLPERNWVSRSL